MDFYPARFCEHGLCDRCWCPFIYKYSASSFEMPVRPQILDKLGNLLGYDSI